MTVVKKICDRCKKEFKYTGWTAQIKGLRKIYIHKMRDGGWARDSYCEDDVELCADCTKELEVFLKGE